MRKVLSYRLQEILAEKQQLIRRRKRTVYATGFAAVLVVVCLCYILFVSSVFGLKIDAVRFSGIKDGVSETTLRQALAPLAGKPLPALSKATVTQAITGADIRIRNAEVSRRPLHGLAISLTMRTPIGKMTQGSAVKFVDSQGIVFTSTAKPEGLPEIVVPNSTLVRKCAPALGEIQKLLPTDVAGRIVKYQCADLDHIYLFTKEGARILWGGDDATDLKAKTLTLLLTRPAKEYDLTDPLRPVTR
ncbi:MAG: FtsQ-type POTRA domain-containing protein [Actinomycetaceae bacterium]|nr:FtsQ-type POTRA domain-containing protein [Actinomycetaceae bacterium]